MTAMLYPELPPDTEVLAIGLAFVVGAPIGLGCYALLRPLRGRGRIGRFIAQFWASWLALAAGSTTAVAVGGPYVIGNRRPFGGGETTPLPLTRPAALQIDTIVALAYATFGLAGPYTQSRSGESAPDV